MGAYLSKPEKEKSHESGENEAIRFASTSMQGWRVHQEDAHNCIVDFADGCSFFAVYDGHGGREVSAYLANTFPDFLKTKNLLDQKENFEEAMRKLFVEYDAHLRQDETVKQMSELKAEGSPNPKEIEDPEEADKKERENLYEETVALSQEADLSIEQIIKQYAKCRNILIERIADQQSDGSGKRERTKRSVVAPSPQIVKRRKTQQNQEETTEEDTKTAESKSTTDKEEEGKIAGSKENKDQPMEEEVKEEKNGEVNGSVPPADPQIDVESVDSSEKDTDKGKPINELEADKSENEKSDKKESTQEQEIARQDDKGSDSHEDFTQPSASTTTALDGQKAAADEAEDEADDSDYVNEEETEEEDDDEDEEAEAEDADEEEEEDEEDEKNLEDMILCGADAGGGKAGFDSGSTACALLLFKDRIYCANIGDSRSVLCRSGKAVDLSADHKPEDTKERERIEAAGGTVSEDGRVNGGLNLSRAFGDHFYKNNADLALKDQMITALPDITVTERTSEDDFVLIACDGIWNSMSSQAVCDFVSERIASKSLQDIGAELCDHCCAKDTAGDGSGCDNETVILIDLKKDQRPPMISSQSAESTASTQIPPDPEAASSTATDDEPRTAVADEENPTMA